MNVLHLEGLFFFHHIHLISIHSKMNGKYLIQRSYYAKGLLLISEKSHSSTRIDAV